MRLIKRRRTKFVAAVVGVIAMTIAASRQLYLSVLFGSSPDLASAPGGKYHLWLALGALLMTCVASGLTFFFFISSEDKGSGLRAA
jgi:hypothetical protein